MTFPSRHTDPILRITLTLAEYPILSDKIRSKMRKELYRHRFTTPQDFEAQVREQAIRSQRREGLADPYGEETGEMWELRQERVRDHLTDFYFAANLPYELFEQIVLGVVKPTEPEEEITTSFNPELAPKYMLFEQAHQIERKPPEERAHFEPLLQEIKVVLIRTMISDQLAYVRIAKKWLTIDVLQDIWRNKIGYGRIGGKSAGMLLAYSILKQVGDEDLRDSIRIPDSYFLGSDLMYTFMTMNNLLHWNDQKYKPEEAIRAEYPKICEEYLKGDFPADILERLADMLNNLGNHPIIVRSSSQLEDNFGFSFAGKYDSYFCPNQGTPQENLKDLTSAIARIYACTLNPDALLYRRSKGLQDYDERMAILIQVVEGEKMGQYFLPHGAGVAFSRNLYRWSPRIRREDGFMRLVWGLGTRAVDAVGNDYPRMVALSEPTLRPDSSSQAIRHYSQQYVDLIDLKENSFKTLSVKEVLMPNYKPLRLLAQIYRDGFITSLRSTVFASDMEGLILTFDDLLRRTPFPDRMRRLLQTVEKHYKLPVDLEFTIQLKNMNTSNSDVEITIVQCRPQSQMKDEEVIVPDQINENDILLTTHHMVPLGYVGNIHYVLFVPADPYFALTAQSERQNIARIIGRLNQALENHTFICVGPGRWGTTNTELGVSVSYSDIYHARALIEMTGKTIGSSPEPSFGTHFFQDLMESNTYPLVINLDHEGSIFKQDFFFDTPNCIAEFLPAEILAASPYAADCVRLIEVSCYRSGYHLDLIMNDDQSKAIALLIPDPQPE
ncbi:MAG TPA: PEP/pyruvate-binding domain-containing protein [Anaerolineales bacterium]|nr:PEP/pyruvate-binding domain-containing protein [Anaerolineales bacterium]